MMKLSNLAGLGLAMAMAAGAQSEPAASKVGIINIQSALVSTKDGQKAVGEIQTRFTPKKSELDRKQGEISELQDKLNKGRNTLSEEARQGMMRDIDQKTKALTRATEDAQAEFDQEQQKIMNELGGKMMALIGKYAKDNGFAIILDISSPQTPVLYASNNIDITKDIVDLYDKSAPGTSAAPSASATVPKPAAAPPVKRPAAPAAPSTAAPK